MFSAKRFLAAGVLAMVGGLGLLPTAASADSFDRHDRYDRHGGRGGVHVVRRYYDGDCYGPPVRHDSYTYRDRDRDCDGPVYYRTYRNDHHRDRDIRYFRGRVGEVYRYYDR